MFIKVADKKDKNSEKTYRYYKLCESYRIGNKTRHRAILNLGKLENIDTRHDQKLLADRIEQILRGGQSLFETEIPEPIEKYAHYFSSQIKQKGLTKGAIEKTESKRIQSRTGEYQQVDLSSIGMEDVRETGCEWLCKQTLEELELGWILAQNGWSKSETDTALMHIISKATYPVSEHKTAQWINENSAVAELFGVNSLSINRFQLYKASKKLYKFKPVLEEFLSVKTDELFDLNDKIILCDLTNTYFEGRKEASKLAKFYKSKEKRSDAKLVALALVVNVEGFVKFSNIYRGNIADCSTLEGIVDELSVRTSVHSRRPIVVIDAGIATEDNLKMLRAKQYQYVCVSRSKLKDYKAVGDNPVILLDKREQPIEVKWVEKPGDSDKYLYVRSQMKAVKEQSMNDHFCQRYEEELDNLAQSIHKKRGTKRHEKVLERIGRIKERYPSANKYYSIDIKAENGIAVLITWKRKTLKTGAQEGVYFLRSHIIQDTDEKLIWDIYNTIREVEASFRTLKSDLNLRPVYHQKDENTEAHLFLAILAYTVVNTIRYRLKQRNIHHDWKNIVRIMNTQKMATITMCKPDDKQLNIRVCGIPSAGAQEIYAAMRYKVMPFYRKNIVLPE